MFTRLFNRAATTPNPANRLSTAKLLHQRPCFGFARYYNKAQAAALNMKDDMLSYEFKPDAMNTLVPSPQYIEPALKQHLGAIKAGRDSLDRKRTSILTKRQNEARYSRGRLFSHLKLYQIKQSVKDVRAKALDQAAAAKGKKKKSAASAAESSFEMVPVDDSMGLPMGTEFDFVIKAKAEEIDQQKMSNNVMMDELVEKLGYMDYRDALACNRYIIEAKRSQDYHQAVRGRILEQAFARLDEEKRARIQREARAEARQSGQLADDVALKQLMAEDSEIAQMYQEDFAEEKRVQEVDLQRIEDVHDRFGYFKQENRMANKVKDKRYDLATDHIPDTEDECFTTEFEIDDMDPQDIELYKRYKLMHESIKEDQEYIDEQMAILARHQRAVKLDDRNNASSLRSWWDIKEELMDKKFAKKVFSAQIENYLAHLRLKRSVGRLDPVMLTIDDMGTPDPEFGIQQGFEPYNSISEADKVDASMPLELRKLLNRNEPELQNVFKPVFDEVSRKEFLDYNTLKMKLFEAKWNWYKNETYAQMEIMTKNLHDESQIADDYDTWISNRVDYMYNYLDFDNDRTGIRNKFLNEMHKKTTVKDIGEKLDEFVLSSKAAVSEYWDLGKHPLEEPRSPQKDLDQTEFDWQESLVKSFDPKKPNWLDDESQIDELASDEKFLAKDALAEIKFRDQLRDHSIGNLNAQEHQEIALFHTMRQDPFYRHHMRTHLSKFAEENSMTQLNGLHTMPGTSDDFTKFDRINLFDFRRTLPQKEREAKLDQKGRAWGMGKRKASVAFANVRAGSGRITVNSKPFIQYFHQPHQRYLILKPLTVTAYTCMVDVEIRVSGGGTTGQAEACIPAVSKALQNFDVKARRPLKYLGMLKNDPRRVERKKPGLQKARKGQVYRRR